MNQRDLIVFDMDGVLVDVSDSYRAAIVETVRHFTGREISREAIQDYKNAGGWNNDWALSQQIIRDFGREVAYTEVVDYFVKIFFGAGGLIQRERWIARDGLLEGLADRFEFAIFTGRLHEEARVTLERFAGSYRFDPVIAAEDVVNGKPAPDGLLQLIDRFPGRRLWYIGDTVDDARSARAAEVPFVGIAAKESPRRDELVRLLESEGAIAVVEDINSLPEVLAQ